jgi:hypothetical protein
MQAEINNAYQSAKSAMSLWEMAGKSYIKTLEQLAVAEANYKSTLAMVSKEFDRNGTSKTALKDVVKGDTRVLETEAKVTELKRLKEAGIVRIEFLKAQYDLEKKRMQAEMDEAVRIPLNN